MKNKIKNKLKTFFKCYLPGFILGIISACTISVIAATYFPSNQTTYDNTNTELQSENVQDAIDELYGVCFPKTAGDTILDNTDIVTSGDGLYEDEYENGRYFYKGANPNNYGTVNNEQAGWRIVSIEPDGTIKIMRINSIGNQYWDTSESNNWARPASLNTYLNGTYYNTLNSTAQSQIVAKDWGIGAVTYNDSNLANTINNENGTKWNGKVALATVSEYIRSNSNKNSCGSFSLNDDHYNSCVNTGWMDTTAVSYWWTLSPNAGNSSTSFGVRSYGYVSYGDRVSGSGAIRPVLYLSSEVTLTGTGTQSDPYVVNS